MRTTDRPTFIQILCWIGEALSLVCLVWIVWSAIQDYHIKTVNTYTEQASVVETFYTTDRYGGNEYYIMWETDNATDIFNVCSTCYARYRDAETIPITVQEIENKKIHGYNYMLHTHYNYERTDK